MKKVILLAFDAEQTFIMNELRYYHQHNDEIKCTLLTMYISEQGRKNIENVDVVMLGQSAGRVQGWLQKLMVLPQLLGDILQAPWYYFQQKSIRYQWNRLASKRALALKILPLLKNGETVLSYWFEEEALCLSYIKKMHPQIHAISRAHAFDLYEEEQRGGRQPFRSFMLKYMDTILPVSSHGVRYLQEKYPQYSKKFTTGKLGIWQHNIPLNEAPEYPVYVSCGAVSKRKRTLEILELIKKIPGATWIHFGSGDLFETLEARASEVEGIRVELKGHVSIDAVMEYYKNHKITAFISLSSSEGVPVSMMEAISCGIPVIATNAGGTADLVTETTGLLTDIDYNVEALLSSVLELSETKFKDSSYRQGVQAYWAANYNAEKNYKNFTDTIIQ